MSYQSRTRLMVFKADNGKTTIHPLLLDLYEITMAYAYWKSGKTLDYAVFDLYFRTNPFKGEYTIFAGLEEALKYLEHFQFSDSDIEYLRTVLPADIDLEFFTYLSELRTDEIKIYSPPEGTVMFPRIPLLRVEGPLIMAQIVETTLLNLINFASLMTTNAARFRQAAGEQYQLIEMGLRRAQGPDGAITASRYAYIGGFDATSNCLSGKLFGVPCKGTQAHSYVSSFTKFSDLRQTKLKDKCTQTDKDLLQLAVGFRKELAISMDYLESECNDGELTAFVSWGIAFPDTFFALVDTYEMRNSGLYNFCAVALGLNKCGHRAIGIRIDSGDLAYLSIFARNVFKKVGSLYNLDWFDSLKICCSNSITEKTLYSLNDQGHSIDVFGVGTHLVTCQEQPALGGVYKLVELEDIPRMKLTAEAHKLTIPGKKKAYRLYGQENALVDLLMLEEEPAPEDNKRILCRHPFIESKRAFVTPARVECLHTLVFEHGKIVTTLPSALEIKNKVKESLGSLRADIKRNLNPTPYKVCVSEKLYGFLHSLWLQNAPIGMLK